MKRKRQWVIAAVAAAAVWTAAPESRAWLLHEHVHIGRTALSVPPVEAQRSGQPPLAEVLTRPDTFSTQIGASLDVEDRRISILGLFVRLSTAVRKYKYP